MWVQTGQPHPPPLFPQGEEVTFTTQRVVETSKAHGHTITRRGLMPHADQDWQVAEHQKLAVFRKAQLRDIRMLQREEQKECNDLVVRLRAERETTDMRQAKEMADLQKEYERELLNHDKVVATEMEKLEREQVVKLASRDKALQAEHAKQLKRLKSDNQVASKSALARAKSLPKGERKEKTKEAKEELEQTFATETATLVLQQTNELEKALAEMRQSQRAERLRRRLELMQREHELLQRRTEELSRLGEQHILEKQQMLKHQLKATFLMQKHQMHYRHEKEAHQLHDFHSKKLRDLEKKYELDLKLLPKVGGGGVKEGSEGERFGGGGPWAGPWACLR
jgi:hypothetical protein